VFRVHISPPCILDRHDYGYLGGSCQFWSDIIACVLWEEIGGGKRGTEERGLGQRSEDRDQRSDIRGQWKKAWSMEWKTEVRDRRSGRMHGPWSLEQEAGGGKNKNKV
jgi:hypothetical protein